MTELSRDSIETGQAVEPPIIVAYGQPGIGKTSMGAAAPGEIFVQCEKGIGRLAYNRFPVAKSFGEVMEALRVIYADPKDDKTVVLDNLSRLEQMIHQEVRRQHGDDIFASYGRGFKLVIPYVEKLISALSALRDDKGLTILILAHSKIERFESPEVDAYDRYELDCHDTVQKIIYKWSDMVLFMSYKVTVSKEDLGFNQKRGRGRGTGDRVIYTEERPTHLAKNRYDLPYEIPLEKPFDWDGLLSYVRP